MDTLTRKVMEFVAQTRFENLPAEVIHESKRILLDSIGVALASLRIDKGRLGLALAKRLGGSPESVILGTDIKVSCANAAFANGELINAMNYDAFIYPTHCPPSIIPAVLALGEPSGASGKKILLCNRRIPQNKLQEIPWVYCHY